MIDTKRYSGRITKGSRGSFFTSRAVVTVGGRDRSKLIDGVDKQIDVVAGALDDADVPIRGALCFVDGDWGLRFKPFSINGVLITWPKALKTLLRGPGTIEAARFDDVVQALTTALPPAP